MSTYQVEIKPIAPQTVASLRQVIPTPQEVGQLFEKLFTYLGQCGVNPTGPTGAIWHNDGQKNQEWDVQVIVPVAQALPAGHDVQMVQLPEVTSMACAIHQGSYEGFPQAYAAIMGWIEQAKYRVAGPMREIYLRGPGLTPTDPSTYVTEIQVPVAKA